MMPTRDEVIKKLREDYCLSGDEVRQILRAPTHPHGLRDDFAGQALQGLVACAGFPCDGGAELAVEAYCIADKMLQARIGGQP